MVIVDPSNTNLIQVVPGDEGTIKFIVKKLIVEYDEIAEGDPDGFNVFTIDCENRKISFKDSSSSKTKSLNFLHAANSDVSLTLQSKASGNLALVSDVITLPGYQTRNFSDDAEAADGGIDIGGLYHSGGVLKVRLI